MLKCQATKFNFGIPGESQCFECQQQFDEITDRFIHEFHYHSKVCEGMRYQESKKNWLNLQISPIDLHGILVFCQKTDILCQKFETLDYTHFTNGKKQNFIPKFQMFDILTFFSMNSKITAPKIYKSIINLENVIETLCDSLIKVS